jgi:hypothetical protein
MYAATFRPLQYEPPARPLCTGDLFRSRLQGGPDSVVRPKHSLLGRRRTPLGCRVRMSNQSEKRHKRFLRYRAAPLPDIFEVEHRRWGHLASERPLDAGNPSYASVSFRLERVRRDSHADECDELVIGQTAIRLPEVGLGSRGKSMDRLARQRSASNKRGQTPVSQKSVKQGSVPGRCYAPGRGSSLTSNANQAYLHVM